jgi:hypothetical protein
MGEIPTARTTILKEPTRGKYREGGYLHRGEEET